MIGRLTTAHVATTSILALCLGAVSATTASAAGIERTAPSTRILFEEGRYLEFSATYASPSQQGKVGAGAPTGDLLESFFTFGAAYKADLTDAISYAVIFDQPVGVDTKYSVGPVYAGTDATLNADQVTGIVSYDISDAFKVYAGIRGQRLNAKAAIPFVAGYTIDTDTQFDLGYMAGVAYQIPDIALRVGLTYYSEIQHDLNTTEFGAIPSKTPVATPQSVTLDFQTGITQTTLLFGSVRWVDWSEFKIEPPNYPLVTLVDYEEDWITYSLGVGQKITENVSVFVTGTYEPASNTVLTTLGPVDGRAGIGAGLTYTDESMSITGGVSYLQLGNATNALATEFKGGEALAAGIRIGFRL